MNRYSSDVPVMSDPPRAYAPPVRNEGGVSSSSNSNNNRGRITPLRQLRREPGPEPEWVSCPFCKKTTTIRRVSEPSDEYKCLTLCCAANISRLFVSNPDDLYVNIDIHCTSCDRHIATVPPDGVVQSVRVSERPPLPTKKQ
ncbi:hypothetical protein F4802DRAFT_586104 [Xylaria palmicola]|nr:hypothetical protein F4802DRAFT_586104 [Xylaria palmicola]